MNPLFSSVACRACWTSAPRSSRSKIAELHPVRAYHHSSNDRSRPTGTPLSNAPVPQPFLPFQEAGSGTRGVQRQPSGKAVRLVAASAAGGEYGQRQGGENRRQISNVEITRTPAPRKPASSSHAAEGALQTVATLPRAFKTATAAHAHLRKLVFAASRGPATSALARLPQNTFSELLRSLDPAVAAVSDELDPAAGICISEGKAMYSPLGKHVDVFGVRKVYLLLARRMVAAAQLRLETGFELLPSDYKVLLRCAGAASDLHLAKGIWHMMQGAGAMPLRDGSAYAEFIKARFLTEPLYAQHDLARFRVRPMNLFKMKKIGLPRWRRTALRRLRRSMLLFQKRRFGQNRAAADKAESLTRILRKDRPIMKVYYKVLLDEHTLDEDLLCAAMVAFARTGSLRFIETRILAKFWRIYVRRDQTGQVTVEGEPVRYRPDSPMFPTERLLDAVVQSFGCNAEIAKAVKIVDFISQRYGVPISDRIWSGLLEWTYVQASRPASQEWKMADWPGKTVRADAVQMVWDTMTAEPYNVRPGFAQYDLAIRSLIARGRLKSALGYMLELEPHYGKLLAALEDAFYRYVQSAKLGVDASRARQAWLAARAQKDSAWHTLHSWCREFLQRVRSNRFDDDLTVRLVPQLVDAFRTVLPDRVKYRISTGLVQIRNAQPVRRVWTAWAEVEKPQLVTQDVAPRVPRAWQRVAEPGPAREAADLHWRLRRRRTRVAVRRKIAWQLDDLKIHEQPLRSAEIQRQFT